MSRLSSYCGPNGPASPKQIVATSVAIVNAVNHVVFTDSPYGAGASPVPTPHPGPNWDDEFTNELRMYEKLKSLQGKQIPVCYGEAHCHGTRALVLEDVGGVSLYHRAALVETSEEQIAQMVLASYRPIISLNIAYDDWKLDNLYLVDGRVVFLDLEYVYELDFDPERAIQLGRAAILERWHQFRGQYHEYGEIEM
ncbi:hypothetical protein BM221_001842 [Beauveria bassiana]|uniref:Aminoglycoside phosphotransferase domain-containing protein n=1 Tax=Beauveria bassiana TaxID=176275 RepID=A0A2N6NWU9_BEABA|nr:hypothetical protein BM221_001842 [Beauveria bassiana]